MTTAETTTTSTLSKALRRLYFARFAFAIIWAGLLFTASSTTGPFLTTLLVLYPLFDAAAVFWQLRSKRGTQRPQATEWINVLVSVLVAIALGIASSESISTALAVWGAWAVGAGIPQLITAIRHRASGGQVPQMLSGGISAFAGAAFLAQGLRGAESITNVGGYAIVGGVFFLISAIRLNIQLRASARPRS